jgi:hypothetical protein
MNYIFIHLLTQTPQTRSQIQFLIGAHFTKNPILNILSGFIGYLAYHKSIAYNSSLILSHAIPDIASISFKR